MNLPRSMLLETARGDLDFKIDLVRYEEFLRFHILDDFIFSPLHQLVLMSIVQSGPIKYHYHYSLVVDVTAKKSWPAIARTQS